MDKLILSLLVFLILTLSVHELIAQEEEDYYDEETVEEEYYPEPSGFFFSFDFDMDIPIFLSRQNRVKPAYGIHSQLLYQPIKTKPVFFGFSVSVGQYESESLEYYDFTEFEENLFRETTNCSMLHLDFKTRYFPNWEFWIMQPFIDIVLGARNSFAYTSVHNVDYDDNVRTSFHEADWGLEYGGGIGTLIKVEEENVSNVFFHFSLNYMGGENSFFYIIKEDVNGIGTPLDRFDHKSIPFQFLKLNAGVIAYF